MSLRTVIRTALTAATFSGIVLYATPASAAGHGQDADAARVEKVIRCVTIDQQNFCTELGFLDRDTQGGSWKEFLSEALDAPGSEAGDMGFVDLVTYLETLTPSELAARQKEQIAAAKKSVGKVILMDLLATGQPIPEHFFDAYPDLRIAEGSSTAVALRAKTAGQDASTALVASEVPYPPSRLIMGTYLPSQVEQERSYWCGVATMQVIDWANDGGRDSQTYWAGALGTTTNGTALSSIVAKINSDTTWDDLAGTYAVVSAETHDGVWLKWVMQYNVGLQGSPVVLHPTLRKQFFSYLNLDHGGHFQTGRGYDDTKVYYIEPYSEIRFNPSTGAYTSGYRSVSFDLAMAATLYTSTAALRTIGY